MKILQVFTPIPCCYGNTVPDIFLRIIDVSILPSYCGKQNHTLTLVYMGGRGKFCPQAVFATVQNRLALDLLKLCDFYF